MSDKRLQEALAAIQKAEQSAPGNFQDQAGEALALCKRAFLTASKEAPELLDTLQQPEDMAHTLSFLLKTCESRRNTPTGNSRKGKVKDCFKVLFNLPTSPWLSAAARDEKLKGDVLDFLRSYEDMGELKQALEAGPPAPKARAAKRREATGALAPEGREGEESPRDQIRRMLSESLAVFRDCDYAFPTGLHSEEASDRANAAMDNFYKAVAKLFTSWNRESADAGAYEQLLNAIGAEEIPLVVNFLVTYYKANNVNERKITFTVDKLSQVSSPFRAEIQARSAATQKRLPWL